MSDKPIIMCGGYDITEHVANLFDALVGSMDWGSDFLDDEIIASALMIAQVAGYAPPTCNRQEEDDADPRPPYIIYGKPGNEDLADKHEAWRLRAINRWQVQMRAKIDALIKEAQGET